MICVLLFIIIIYSQYIINLLLIVLFMYWCDQLEYMKMKRSSREENVKDGREVVDNQQEKV